MSAREPLPRPDGLPRVERAIVPLVLVAPVVVAGLLLASWRATGDARAAWLAGVVLVGTGAFNAMMVRG